MMRRKNTTRVLQWLGAVWILALAPALLAEPPSGNNPPPGNPFGNVEEGGVMPPPLDIPPPEDFTLPPPELEPPGENFSPQTTKQSPSVKPSANLPSGPPRSVPIKKPTKEKGGEKLADYLELDSSVRGLEVKNFDLNDRDIKDVVTLISKWTGKNFIYDQKIRGKITILGPSQVSLQEAYEAFLSSLEANGLTTVQEGKYIRIIDSQDARRSPVKTYAGQFAPKDAQYITRIFKLNHISADEVQREFRDLTTRNGKLFAYDPTNHIIITDTASNIQRLKDILETLDVEGVETSLHVVRIKNGSAKSIAEMLGDIYSDDPGKGGGARGRTFRRNSLERTRGGGIISKIIPDEQTNSLVVLANEIGIKSLRRLVEKLDIRVTDTGRIHVYYCEYAKAEDLAQTLASLAGGGPKASSKKASTPPPAGGAAGSNAPAPTGGGGPVTAELEGGVKITSDAPTNSLVITASSTDFQTLKRVIKKLDVPRLQVFIETAILEIALGNSDNIGLNLGLAGNGRLFAGGIIGDTNSLLKVLTNSGIPQGLTIPFSAGGSSTVQVGGQNYNVNSINGIVNLLAATSSTSVLSTPQIIALDNEKSEFRVQDEIPVQDNFTASLGAGVAGSGIGTGTISYKKVGISIKLTPHVNATSRNIRLEIEQNVDSLKTDSSVPTAIRDRSVATTNRYTNTSVVVRDKDYIMLGGLISDKVDEQYTKVPFLGDIPILGWLFKSRTLSKTKSNLVILLKPQIIGNAIGAANLVEDSLDKRKEFIKENGAEEINKKTIRRIKKDLQEQRERGKTQREYDYRNNSDEEDKQEDAAAASKSEEKETPSAPLLQDMGNGQLPKKP